MIEFTLGFALGLLVSELGLRRRRQDLDRKHDHADRLIERARGALAQAESFVESPRPGGAIRRKVH